jgi:hypothetical protein
VTGAAGLHSALARALAATPAGQPLSWRLCHASRAVSGADGSVLTVDYTSIHRVTLCSTDALSGRLEDLQDVVGEGPGHSASRSGDLQRCSFPPTTAARWAMFVEAAEDLVEEAVVTAVPMRPGGDVMGVLTLYQRRLSDTLSLDRAGLLTLAAAVGAALMTDPGSHEDLLDDGPWSGRAEIHQAMGMTIAQLGVSPEDALALLRAHAYAGQTTLSAIAAAIVARELTFTHP